MIEEKVKNFLKQKNFSLKGKRILVGVSGGPDSLALLNFLWEDQRRQQDFYMIVAHVDHMFRGAESFSEAKFVERFCADKDIPFRMKRINVPEYIKKTGKSPEVAGRECRYQFLAEVMNDDQLTHLALGHHGDDQIETMLMRLTRGSSGSARAGIPFMRPFQKGFIVRPFLCLSRKDIEQYCVEHELDPRHDPSNGEDDYLRNRFRKYVVPFLKRENTHVHEHFQRFSEELQMDEAFLQELAFEQMSKVWKEKNQDRITIEIDLFQAIPIPLQRRGIQLILNYLYKKRPASLSAIHIDHIFSLLKSENPSGKIDLPLGLKVVRSYQECHFQFFTGNKDAFRFELKEPGEYALPNGDSIILEYTNDRLETNTNDAIQLNRCDTLPPIIVRTREQGDRMSLKGMQGTKKIKDIFIDQKIPVEERNLWPVITDSHNRILWLPGLKKCQDTREDHGNHGYILLSFIKKN